MGTLIVAGLFTLIIALGFSTPTRLVHAGDVRCTTREDRELRRWVTTCTDGIRAVTRYEADYQRWRTDIKKDGAGKKPYGWARPPASRH